MFFDGDLKLEHDKMLYVNKRGDDDVDVKRCDVWDPGNLVSNFHEHKVDGKDNAFHRKKDLRLFDTFWKLAYPPGN